MTATNPTVSAADSPGAIAISWSQRAAFLSILGGTAGLCVVDAMTAHSPTLSIVPLAPLVVRGAAILFLLGTLIAWARPHGPWGYVPAAYWVIGIVSGLLAIDAKAVSMPDFVPPMECLIMAIAVVLATVAAGRRKTVLIYALAAMLALFGAIHWRYPGAIAELIPAWFPSREVMPYFTGGVMIAACPALLIPAWRTIAAYGVAAMFGSWLVFVHAPHILAAPGGGFEWRFALTAVCLAGAVLSVARPSDGAAELDQQLPPAAA